MGEAERLSKGEGTGELMRRGGESKACGSVSSPSERPEISRFTRGRRVELAVVEVVWAFVGVDMSRVAKGTERH